MEFKVEDVLDNAGGDYNRLGRCWEKGVEAQTRESTSARQQQDYFARWILGSKLCASTAARVLSRSIFAVSQTVVTVLLLFWPLVKLGRFIPRCEKWTWKSQNSNIFLLAYLHKHDEADLLSYF